MIIPWQEIDQETLNNLMESIVLREGTDYGSQELSFETKVEQLKQRLKSGEAIIVYSELHESVDVVNKDSVTGNEPGGQ
ncbi:YheU family protein [Idiomarina loihiensis]|uniref:YheU family protein n=1 Tax=Idiomarina loihiensis TaxID=135577 RepID=UPI00129CE3D5|nr:YheU family protein [Idiomarina loihiensis]MRJ44635.1 YheU family protein [Idiomarina loihiensis]UTW32340.1 YheU family protein [Idiomarina loihiensis]